jgi:hypothetical protein
MWRSLERSTGSGRAALHVWVCLSIYLSIYLWQSLPPPTPPSTTPPYRPPSQTHICSVSHARTRKDVLTRARTHTQTHKNLGNVPGPGVTVFNLRGNVWAVVELYKRLNGRRRAEHDSRLPSSSSPQHPVRPGLLQGLRLRCRLDSDQVQPVSVAGCGRCVDGAGCRRGAGAGGGGPGGSAGRMGAAVDAPRNPS